MGLGRLLAPQKQSEGRQEEGAPGKWLFLVEKGPLVVQGTQRRREPGPIPAARGRQRIQKRAVILPRLGMFFKLEGSHNISVKSEQTSKILCFDPNAHFSVQNPGGCPPPAPRGHLARRSWGARRSPDKLLSSPQINNHQPKYLCLLWGFVCA